MDLEMWLENMSRCQGSRFGRGRLWTQPPRGEKPSTTPDRPAAQDESLVADKPENLQAFNTHDSSFQNRSRAMKKAMASAK